MSDEMSGGLDRRLLYRFIGMAFDAVAKMSRSSVYGDAEAFLTRLYLRRMASVFGEPIDEDGAKSRDLKDVVVHLHGIHRWRADDILSARPGKIEVDAPNVPNLGGGQEDQGLDARRFDAEAELGIEAYATYLPIHFFPEGHWREEGLGWGIYISEAGVRRVAQIIEQGFVERYGDPRRDGEASFLRIAFEVLLRHEMEHFKVESFALSAEMQQRRPLYVPYLMNVYAETYPTSFCLEESLANATVLDSTVIKKLVYTLYPQEPRDGGDLLAKTFFEKQPAAYANYSFKEPWHRETDKARIRQVKYSDRPRRDAMNYLCNQIISGSSIPTDPLLPFYAFPPDNFFLRAESLVPVYILKDLDEHRSFIHFPTPTRAVWERFLRRMDFFPTDKGKGDHVVWERPGFDMITNNFHGKELDLNSFRSALHTLGISRKEFDRAVRNRDALVRVRARLDELAYQPLFA